MCGRFTLTSSPAEIAAFFGAERQGLDHAPDYNVAPTTDIVTVVGAGAGGGGGRTLELMHWGLVPSWAKDISIGSRMINARSETLAEKPSFRRAFVRRRCIVVADGFYEWQAVPGQKRRQPMYIARTDGDPLAFAGLWEIWHPVGDPERTGMELHSCTIVTCAANGKIAPVHHRMPVVLEKSDWSAWLDVEGTSAADATELLRASGDEVLTFHPVSTDVNRVGTNNAHLIDPVEPDSGDHDGQMRLL
jgi:putative SOS response-associated peptidase YedK